MSDSYQPLNVKRLTDEESQLLTQLLGLRLPQKLAAQIELALEQRVLPVPEMPEVAAQRYLQRDPGFNASSLIETGLALVVALFEHKQDGAFLRCPMCEGRGQIWRHGREPILNDEVTLQQLVRAAMICTIKMSLGINE